MEKKIYHMENLGCANCAAKMEAKFNAHPGVESAAIVFATKQLRLTAENCDALIPELQELARTVESGIVITSRDSHHGHDHHDCGCGHDHHGHDCGCGHDHHGCSCGHDHQEAAQEHKEKPEALPEHTLLIYGGVLFAAGLLLDAFGIGWLSFLCCVIAYVLLGREILATAARNLVKGHVFDENFLMSVATLGAFLIGEAPEAVGVMLFYRVGEFFEHRAVERSRSQIMAAVDLRPETVNLLVRGKVRITPAERVLPGALVLVRPGDRIPLDGTVVSGESRIDTAPITGEPVPVHVAEGDSVISGCINTVGQLTVRVEKPLSESMVTRILDSVENAAASKPKIDRFITRFARIYTPIVVAAAAAVAIVPSLATGNWHYWVYTALTFLVMSCPCALVLSVPLAFFSGIGVGSRQGILFKGGQSMEALGKVKAVVMDKTGTLTRGDFRVQKVVGQDDLLTLCASCEQQSSHPIAASITAAAREHGLVLKTPESLEELAGQGIRAVLEGKTILCGNARLMEENGIAFEAVKEPDTVVLVAVDGKFAGSILIADTLKSGAAEAVQKMKASGMFTAMLTGDSGETAHAVAAQTGVEAVFAGLLPHQKLERLQAIRQEKGAVLFVGDGINDAPVLAGADVGAAMGSGADAAIEAADVVFMTSDAEAIPAALDIAGKTLQVAWQNVIFALAVKFAVMVLGLFGFASMWLAVFADSGVAMLCVLNSIRMLYTKK
ncbi:MAG: cadmium-translocating P-type ATPase [Oscillospiraceae bacterium]|nr:cadmium-translocating P-type ATPase [Oscillospiraceae bacterium]